MTLFRRGAGLIALALCCAGGPAAAQGTVAVESPPEGAAFGWGRFPPQLRLAARIQADGPPARRFLTANVTSGGQPVDGVRLYDDGSHGDEQAGDAVFTAGYYPPRAGAYEVRVRAQWNDAGGRLREAYSEPRAFWVEQVPYADVVHPEAGGRVGEQSELRGRLLLGGEPYLDADPTLVAEAWTRGGAEGERKVRARRERNRLTAPLRFSGVGPREVGVDVSVERRGQRLQTLSEPKRIEVAQPPFVLLILGLAVATAYLWLPPRKAVPLWRHEFHVRGPDGNLLGRFGVESHAGEPVRQVVGGGDAKEVQAVLEGVKGALFAVEVAPGQKQPVVQALPGVRLTYEKQETATARPRAGETFVAGGHGVKYVDARSLGQRRFSRWLPTPAKVGALVLGLGLLAAGWWQWREFFAQ